MNFKLIFINRRRVFRIFKEEKKMVICNKNNIKCSFTCWHSKPHDKTKQCLHGVCIKTLSSKEGKFKCVEIVEGVKNP